LAETEFFECQLFSIFYISYIHFESSKTTNSNLWYNIHKLSSVELVSSLV
jgi:hypothetical protein